MDIYIKAIKKFDTSERTIRLKDIADIVSDDPKIGQMAILRIDSKKNFLFLVSMIDIIRAVKNEYPHAHVYSIGEKDTVINFSISKRKPPTIIEIAKVSVVSAILLFGSATAIMSFFTDAEIARLFENFFRLIFGVDNNQPLILEIPFSVGIGLGIIVFFNHFAGLKLTRDPTPIEVEMSLYEKDIADTMIDSVERVNEMKSKDGKNEGNN